jgi:hypothetical protein
MRAAAVTKPLARRCPERRRPSAVGAEGRGPLGPPPQRLPAGRRAAAIRCPVLFAVYDDDLSAPSELTERVAGRVPGGEVARQRGRHYAPFMESHEDAVDAEVSFLRAHLVERSRAPAIA